MVFNDLLISSTASTVGEIVDHAAYDPSKWGEAACALAEAFPGSFVAIHNVDMSDQHLNFGVNHGIDEHYLRSYEDYYISINPWLDIWNTTPSGTIRIASSDCPATLFSDTEFYNDWIVPQKTVEGAVGIKLDIGPHDMLHMPMHYPLQLSDRYDRPIAEIYTRIRGNLLRAVDHARRLQEVAETGKSVAALIERAADIAFVVDGRMKLRDANQAALDAFNLGAPVSCSMDKVTFQRREVNKWFSDAVACLARGKPTDMSYRIFRDRRWIFRVSVSAIPASSATFGPASMSQRSILVLVRDLRSNSPARDISYLTSVFGLTPAEVQLAKLIADGCTLKDAADQLAITTGTARQRLKTIFGKTDTHRQSELVALLLRLS